MPSRRIGPVTPCTRCSTRSSGSTWEGFLRAAADPRVGGGLPRFVEQEFRDFLTCGVLAHGLARVRCAGCAFERPVPFSCKGRGFCPSCGGRRMAERAAHLVDAVAAGPGFLGGVPNSELF